MRQWKFWAVILAAGWVVGCNSAEKTQNESSTSSAMLSAPDVSAVIAKVGDWDITEAYFDARYQRLTPSEKARFSGENWKKRFLDYLVEETLLYKSARDNNYDRLSEVARDLDFQMRTVLVSAYHNKMFREDIRPPLDAIEAYYDENQDEFKMQGRALGRHVQCASKEKIDEAYQELQNGTHWGRVTAKYSEDTNTADNGGLLGWFNPAGYVLGMGFNEEFTQVAFDLEVGVPSAPVKIGDNWHIIRIDGKTEERVDPLAEVQDRIIAKLRPVYAKQTYASHMKELREHYGIERFGEYMQDEVRTPEQLYRLAAESQNGHAKIDYYQTLVDLYPEHERAPASQFMIGFLFSEEFGDVPAAAAAFHALIDNYPDNEHVDEAQWMLKNLGRKEPRLIGSASPQDPDEARERIQDVQN